MKRVSLHVAVLSTFFATVLLAQYKLPPKEIVDIIDSAPTPFVSVSPAGRTMLLIESQAHPPVSLLAVSPASGSMPHDIRVSI
jgi:hypothetical protein